MPRRSARGSITRHYDASTRPTAEQVSRVRALAAQHQLPERGATASADRMLTTLGDVLDGDGTGYDANKLTDWMRRMPLRTVAAKVDPGWENHTATYLTAVAEAVLMHGWTPARTGIEYGTTTETVDAIVADYRMKIRRAN